MTTPAEPTRTLLCHPAEAAVVTGQQATCRLCGSFWDLESCAKSTTYNPAYPIRHLHFDERVGRMKVMTLQNWLTSVELDPRDHVICEVGFGGGYCLAYLRGLAQETFGIEAIPENLAHAASLGVPASNLFLFHERPRRLPRPVSLWLFQDSFEHVPDPETFLPWVVDNSTPAATLLIVLPDATSWSRRLLGRYWPHKLPEHLFHWSPTGLVEIYRRFGFRQERRFRPVKRVSTIQAVNHLSLMPVRNRALSMLGSVVPAVEMWFNIGEMGFLFRRGPSVRQV